MKKLFKEGSYFLVGMSKTGQKAAAAPNNSADIKIAARAIVNERNTA